MSDEYADVLTDLLVLRKALRILIAVNHLDSAAELLIAQQTIRLLETGSRTIPPGSPEEDVTPVDFQMDDELMKEEVDPDIPIAFTLDLDEGHPGSVPGTAGWARAQPPSAGTLPQAFYDALQSYDVGEGA